MDLKKTLFPIFAIFSQMGMIFLNWLQLTIPQPLAYVEQF